MLASPVTHTWQSCKKKENLMAGKMPSQSYKVQENCNWHWLSPWDFKPSMPCTCPKQILHLGLIRKFIPQSTITSLRQHLWQFSTRIQMSIDTLLVTIVEFEWSTLNCLITPLQVGVSSWPFQFIFWHWLLICLLSLYYL